MAWSSASGRKSSGNESDELPPVIGGAKLVTAIEQIEGCVSEVSLLALHYWRCVQIRSAIVRRFISKH
jgi:hypothetical protein